MFTAVRKNPLVSSLAAHLPPYLAENIFLKVFGLFRVPMLGFLNPKIVELTPTKSVVKIPLKRRSKNHLSSMYFGALAAGADCVGGLLAMNIIYRQKLPISLVFKDFQADFIRRATDDVYFVCEDGQAVQEQINQVMRTGERVNHTLHIEAFMFSKGQQEKVAIFDLTLSLKKIEKK